METTKRKTSPSEALVWSMVLPGFGQLLLGNYLLASFLLALEVLINTQSHFNEIIFHSLTGDITQAIEKGNLSWLSFYPCVYFFAMFDAYRTAGGGKNNRFSFLPFVFAAYFVTVGVFYSSHARITGHLMGPLWFPIICFIPGVLFGFLLKHLLYRWIH